MSVTKWMHLHGGDDVMREFFQRVKDLLQPGGYFILEPQPWKSYKTAIKKLVGAISILTLGDYISMSAHLSCCQVGIL